MVCLDDLPDLDSLPSDLVQLQAVLEKAEQRLRDAKEEDRRRRQERFRAKRLKQRQQQQAPAPAPEDPPEAPSDAAAQESAEAGAELASMLDGAPRHPLHVRPLRLHEGGVRGIAAALDAAAACGDAEALRGNLAVAEEVLALEPDLAKRRLAGAVESAREKIEELEREAAQREQEAAEAVRRAAEAAAAAEAEREEDAESCTSEDMRVEAEIQELELMLKKHEESRAAAEEESKSTDGGGTPSCARLRSCCSTLSFVTALESVSGECSTATGGSSVASRCTSPSGASVRLEAVPVLAVEVGDATPRVEAEATPVAKAVPIAAAEGADAEATPIAKAPAKGKGKGPGKAAGPGPPKGKGKGKADAPPPPKGAPPPGAKAKAKATPAKPKSSNLVHLHWKVSHEPEDMNKMNKTFLQRLEDLKPYDYEYDGSEASDLIVPERPATIFSPLAPTVEPPREIIEYYFAKCTVSASWAPPEAAPRGANLPDRHKPMLDEKRLNMLGIMIQKYLMENKGQSNLEAILSIKRGVLRCDANVVRLEGLSVIRTVLRQHEKDNKPVCAFVEAHGEAALDGLEFPDHHRLVFELSKVPQIDERLECMLFTITFKESIAMCTRSLKALREALEMLNSKRDTIRRFFVTAHRLGQSLNRESNAPKAPNGFQLSTLEKLSQTKSTKFPKLSILHFVLALMSRKDASDLFNKEDLSQLHAARALKTHKVFQDCVELAQGFYGVQQICETGKYTSSVSGQAVKIERRRLSHTPQSLEVAEPAVDTDDRFHEVMEEFVEQHLEDAEDAAEGAFNVILTYKELALYFDDLPSVYPPPKNENDPRKDLCDIFYRFADDIRKHRGEVESEHLREIIAATNAADAHPDQSRVLPPQLPLASPPRTASKMSLVGSPTALGEASALSGRPSMQPHQLTFTPKNELDGSAKSHPYSPAHSFHMTPSFQNSHVDRAVASEIELLSRTIDRANSIGGFSEVGGGR